MKLQTSLRNLQAAIKQKSLGKLSIQIVHCKEQIADEDMQASLE